MTKSEYYEILNARIKSAKESKKQEREWIDRITKLSKHPDTTILTRESYPDAWAFVENRYPSVANRVATTRILKNDNTAFCKNIGIPSSAGGLYVKPSSTILVFYNRVFPDDIVIVHELLHLVSRMLGGEGSVGAEEGFAYGKSLPYVLERIDREWVIHKYLMPFYIGQMLKKHGLDGKSSSELSKAKKLAEDHCNKMIDGLTQQTILPIENNDVFDGFDFL